MTRHPLLSAVLIAGFATAMAFAAHAQDPAAVGSGGDPALVGGYGGHYGNRYGGGASGVSTGAFGGQSVAAHANGQQTRDKSAREVEALLQLVRGQLDGTADNPIRGNDTASVSRYRNDAEVLVRRNWNQLGPLTRDLYTANYDRTDPSDASQRYRSPYGDDGQIESKLLGGAQDAQGAMQNLEDLLLPMLQDLKSGFDTELRQRANSR